MSTSREDLQVLVVDCQTTGSHPAKGYLLEIGWGVTRAGQFDVAAGLPVTAYLLKLPRKVEVPRHVERLTGIRPDDLKLGLNPANVWDELAAAGVGAISRDPCCPTVIHYARFEEPFLKQFHRENGAHAPFPFDIIYTHEISRRLLPGLPRKGLRVVAGYLGHSDPSRKRCAAHAMATALVWHHLVRKLARKLNIFTLADLRNWLQNTKVPLSTGRVFPMPRKARLGVPDMPGIYRFRRSNADLLYIGKTRSLKQRVNSYFKKSSRHPEHILEMLSQAAGLDVTTTGSALEAALLESEEIKRNRPPYNVALQEGNRQLWFCSRDFQPFSTRPDARHRIGPVPSREAYAALHAIGSYLHRDDLGSSGIQEFSGTTLPGIPSEY